MQRILIFLFVLLIGLTANAQIIYRKVLFLGNSYIFVNDLPALTSALASSAGDSLYYDSNTPGGYTFGWQPIAHATDAVSLSKIGQEGWDFVIMQEQSQTPAIPALRDSCMYPGSIILHDSIKSANPCSRVLFFQTWGRRFGGIQCFTSNYCSPDFADFDQMQDSITDAYKGIADSLDDWIAPVGEAWRWVIENHQVVLHSGDNSHPNIKGSYLAACVFYDVIFGKRSLGLSFYAGLGDTAFLFQYAADTIVFGNASIWNLWNNQPVAGFEPFISSDTLFTDNLSINSSMWEWDFGDGGISTEFEPLHVYSSPGEYKVTLTACDSCRCDTTSRQIEIIILGSNLLHNDYGKGISITSDISGKLQLNGYNGSGNLKIYDMTGRMVKSIKVSSGLANAPDLQETFYLWILEDDSGVRLSQGKLILRIY